MRLDWESSIIIIWTTFWLLTLSSHSTRTYPIWIPTSFTTWTPDTNNSTLLGAKMNSTTIIQPAMWEMRTWPFQWVKVWEWTRLSGCISRSPSTTPSGGRILTMMKAQSLITHSLMKRTALNCKWEWRNRKQKSNWTRAYPSSSTCPRSRQRRWRTLLTLWETLRHLNKLKSQKRKGKKKIRHSIHISKTNSTSISFMMLGSISSLVVFLNLTAASWK